MSQSFLAKGPSAAPAQSLHHEGGTVARLPAADTQKGQGLFWSAGPPLKMASEDGQGASVQRLVLRVRDLNERFNPFASDTIMSSSKSMKKYPLFTQDKWKEDIGIAKGLKGRALDRTEPLVVVSHGSEPKLNKDGTVSGTFADRTPESLAEDVSKILPDDYAAEIFLNGCYTAMRVGFTQKDTSYIERFGVALLKHTPAFGGWVKGNLGLASTISGDEELITLDQAGYDKLDQHGKLAAIRSKDGKKYYLRGGVGQAIYVASGKAYQSFGL